ncbi:MAG: Methionyl-tRNA formyltransferase [Candidatus Curtissbacteria bacterium GW2011_GWA1_41_11]|uniref:Methionyl-tRNA formyltransferase n=1 Tax=Candidatus Curtissbacteria bacterium GW2011_GWA1_41_11 TaxID=1618409 RepID=A0A0G0WU16_9BACT|nr:MAG: Methionyl-tRNA formyltransferase [Candidatus Curtissbacteria bacterium GW2011_GWA1_41_11]
MKIVFLGTPRLAQIVLENLIESDFKPQLIITGEDKKVGRGQNKSSTPVKLTAQKNGMAVGHLLSEVSKNFDLAILVAFGHIIPKDILDKPRFGFINVHPSLLPKYRGPSPIQSAILKGEIKTGVTIIKLDQEVDHGPILNQREIEIEKEDTHESLIEKTGAIGSNLLLVTLPDYLSGKTKPKEQNNEDATFTEKITKADGQIDLQNPPSKQKLERMINAFYPWPTVWTKIDSKIIKFLPKQMIQIEGKRPIPISDLNNGYPQIYSKVHYLFSKKAQP